MRDLLLTLIIFGSIPVILMRPHVGIIMWVWVSIMNPHRLTWSYAFDMPIAMIIGAATITAFVFSRESKKMAWDPITVILLIYVLWTGVTTIFAIEPDIAFKKWLQFNKSMLMVFLTIIIMRTPERTKALIWITVLSVGFFSIKGGIFTVLTGGKYTVWGPVHSGWGANNSFAVAVLMVAPLMHYLAVTAQNKWVKYGMYASFGLSLVAVVGTYSRGALVALLAMLITYWWKSRRKFAVASLLIIATIFAFPLMPDKWFDRMETIETYEKDASAMGRLAIWGFSLELAAKKPIMGGGFKVFEGRKAYDMLNSSIRKRNVHSIYFEALGEHGVVGLILFLLLGITGLRTATWIERQARGHPELTKEGVLARMLKVSLIAYATGGIFLNIGNLDLYYHMLALILLTKLAVQAKLTGSVLSADSGLQSGITTFFAPKHGHHGGQVTTSFLRKKTN